MAQNLVFVELDERGLDYVREHLTGVNAFCTALLDVVATEPGTVFTLVPAGTPPDKLHRFTEGGLLAPNLDSTRMRQLPDGSRMMAVESLKVEQSAYLVSMLRETPNTVCITDDFNPRWGDPQPWRSERAFGVGDEVYHLLTAADPPKAFVDALWDGDTVWHGVAAVSAHAPELDEDRTASVEEIQAAAHAVLVLTCTAYDREGFVIWRRKT